MEIKCPNCGSRFNLPDQLAKPGVKLRCSVCKTVFTYEPEVPLAEQGPLPEMPIKKKLPLVKLALIFVLVLACAGGGWYNYSLKSAAMQPNEQEIAKQIKQVKRGDLVQLKGELVEVRDKDLVWKSSLSPTDIGDGACELFRVNSIQWIEKQKI